jgi:hypothetical protein
MGYYLYKIEIQIFFLINGFTLPFYLLLLIKLFYKLKETILMNILIVGASPGGAV